MSQFLGILTISLVISPEIVSLFLCLLILSSWSQTWVLGVLSE